RLWTQPAVHLAEPVGVDESFPRGVLPAAGCRPLATCGFQCVIQLSTTPDYGPEGEDYRSDYHYRDHGRHHVRVGADEVPHDWNQQQKPNDDHRPGDREQ